MLTSDDIAVLTDFFQFVDTDKDGYVSVEEIKDACAVDINGDGVTSEEERITCAKPWLDRFLAQQDTNTDGKISLQELIAFNG